LLCFVVLFMLDASLALLGFRERQVTSVQSWKMLKYNCRQGVEIWPCSSNT
jgi:hypothetical protein